MEPHYYYVDVTWTSDRKGIVCSPEIRGAHASGCFEVATPPPFPGGHAGIWSPEHLYTASVGTCLMTTFLAIAENSKLRFTGFSCKATGKLERQDGRLLMTEVVLEPIVTISSELEKTRAMRVLDKCESACLISNSVRASIVLKPVIEVREAKTAEL